MSDITLQQWYAANRSMYEDLAKNCGSVAELVLKIEIFGQKWTQWDWVMFFSFLAIDMQMCDQDRLPFQPSYYVSSQQTSHDEDPTSAELLVADVFDVIDHDVALDDVITNRTVLANFIEWATSPKLCYNSKPIYKLLAHVFKKFPSIWSENFMWVKHNSRAMRKHGKARTHRLEVALKSLGNRPAEYFASHAFLEDFISKYYSAKI